MTNADLIAYVEAHLGGYNKSGIVRPMITAMANLAFKDLAYMLLDTDSELAKKLVVTLTGQSWSSSSFSAPSNMLFHKQKQTSKISIGGALVFQVTDRDRMDMAYQVGNHYCVLEGKTFYIKHSAGTTNGNNLDITYYKIPAISDIDDELRNQFLAILMARLIPQQPNVK